MGGRGAPAAVGGADVDGLKLMSGFGEFGDHLRELERDGAPSRGEESGSAGAGER